jgi:hypothetical protein
MGSLQAAQDLQREVDGALRIRGACLASIKR